MNVTMEYFGQIRQSAGAESEATVLAAGATALDAVTAAAARHGAAFRRIVLDDAGALRRSVMVLVNDTPVSKASPPALKDGDRVKLLAAIAGG